MKKILILSLLFLALTPDTGHGQSVRSQPATGSADGNTVFYILPRTVISVYLTAEKETVKKGPYARFAQKYLGTIAPLSDKEIHTLKSARVTYSQESDPSAVYVLDQPDKSLFNLYSSTIEGFVQPDIFTAGASYDEETLFRDLGIQPIVQEKTVVVHSQVQTDTGFVNVPVDRFETTELSLEEMAANAAQAIFTLRQRRFDLITGEAGEYVFGAGLPAAIEEIKRLEDEYLALFLGKRFTETIVRRFDVVPERGKNTLTVCRFSESGGLLADNDLSGSPIVMELQSENKTSTTVLPKSVGKDNRGTVHYRVADIVRCRVIDNKTILSDDRIPVYQFGEVVEIPVSAAR